MMYVRSRLSYILFAADTIICEIVLALVLTGLGVQLLRPTNTFGTALGFLALSDVMDERSWGELLAATGLAQLIAILGNGGMRPPYLLRVLAAMVGVVIWLILTYLFGVQNPAGFGIVIYGVFALASLYTAARNLLRYSRARGGDAE
jgi:hypothetical protein